MLAWETIAPIDLPRYDNSAMDGYAVRFAEPASESSFLGQQFDVIGSTEAGSAWTGTLAAGCAVRIGTGAAVPAGVDAVLPVEEVELHEQRIRARTLPVPGAHIRRRGEDIRAGMVAIRSGTTIRPQEIALLAALGIEQVETIPIPRVAILSIGPELLPNAQPMQVSDTNGPMLSALVIQNRARVVSTEVVDGGADALEATLNRLAAGNDLIVTSGGISDSAGDSLRQLLEYRDDAELWNVRLKPGKHFAMGAIGTTPFFSLPGNPVAALVGFVLFIRPAIERLRGQEGHVRRQTAIATERLKGVEGKTDAIRGHLGLDAQSRLIFSPVGNRGSGVVSSLIEADCLALIPEDRAEVAEGDQVEICPIGVSMFDDGAIESPARGEM